VKQGGHGPACEFRGLAGKARNRCALNGRVRPVGLPRLRSFRREIAGSPTCARPHGRIYSRQAGNRREPAIL